MKRCFVFSAGSFYGLYEKPNREDLIIAADAGLLLCRKLEIRPDFVIGDFDSLNEESPENQPELVRDYDPWVKAPEIIKLPVEKDDTDTMYAVKFGLEKGCSEFILYGAMGGERPDHSIASLQTLAYIKKHGADARLYDKNFIWTVIENETLTIPKKKDRETVSVFAMESKAGGVSLEGLQYPLSEGTLTPAFPLGVSNHIIEDEARITCREGLLLVGIEI